MFNQSRKTRDIAYYKMLGATGALIMLATVTLAACFPFVFVIVLFMVLTVLFYKLLGKLMFFNRLYGADKKDLISYIKSVKEYKKFIKEYGLILPELYKYEFIEEQDIKKKKLFLIKYNIIYSDAMKSYMKRVGIKFAEGEGENSYKSVKERNDFISNMLQLLKKVSDHCCYYYLSNYSKESREAVVSILKRLPLEEIEVIEDDYVLRYSIRYGNNNIVKLTAEIDFGNDMFEERFKIQGMDSFLGIDISENRQIRSSILECSEFEAALIMHRANGLIKAFVEKEKNTLFNLVKEQVTQEFTGNTISNMHN